MISTLFHHSKIICLVLASKTYALEKEWHATKSAYEKYLQYLDSEPVTCRRCSELLKDLENTGLVSKTGSKGRKGYSSEFQLVIDPQIIGEIIDKKWWKEHVVDKKARLDKLRDSGIKKSDPYYGQYQQLKKVVETTW